MFVEQIKTELNNAYKTLTEDQLIAFEDADMCEVASFIIDQTVAVDLIEVANCDSRYVAQVTSGHFYNLTCEISMSGAVTYAVDDFAEFVNRIAAMMIKFKVSNV
jgi:hypothetical protein